MTTWTISTLERELSDGGVIVAHWRATASETVGEGDDAVTYSASSYGTCGFTPDPSDAGFIAYDSLTEADVIGWVQAELDKDAIEASLAAQIEADKNPTQAAGVPW
tara:strand:- start:119 stop:436 length:318 start_codon:yes stop_codon:yes gene_type:complete